MTLRNPSLLGVLLAGLALGCSETPSGTNSNDAFFLSQVDKGEVREFHNRFATPNAHYVVTDRPVAAAEQSVRFTPEPGEELFIVEPRDGLPAKAYPGEKARLGRFAVISSAETEHLHDVAGGPTTYVEPVAKQKTSVSQSLTEEKAAGQAFLRQITREIRLESDLAGQLGELTISKEYLREKVEELSGAVPIDLNGESVRIEERESSEGRAYARHWLRREYEDLGFEVHDHDYDSGFRQGTNVIAEKQGADPNQYFIVSAHYDSVGNAGADDDAAGIISSLAVAKALADVELETTLKIIAFDQEELGLVGSGAYVSHLNETGGLDGLVGVIDLEMTGYDADGDGAYHAIHCEENSSAQLARLFNGTVDRQELPLEKVDACTNRADHASFWRYDQPAIVVSQNFFGGDSNPCYHRTCDTVSEMDFGYMKNLTEGLVRSVASVVVADEG